MEWHEKEFGWLWKNVGGYFPCLFHGLYVNYFFREIKIPYVEQKAIAPTVSVMVLEERPKQWQIPPRN